MDLLEKVVALCKRRGFVFPGSEIYGGLANSYDYGPLGVELKNNVKKLWWDKFVHGRDDILGLDGSVILSPRVWEASGHVAAFTDPLVECKSCHKRFREDFLENAKECPECKGELTLPKMFNGMFKTNIGATENKESVAYLRPETAQAIFINFKNVLDSRHPKLPFGIAQIGKAFRNEITAGNFIHRMLEFEQMEIEYFISPKSDWEPIFDDWLGEMKSFLQEMGVDLSKVKVREHADKERSHYSKKTVDIEYEFPFGTKEVYGLAYRTDFDLKKHSEVSGTDLMYHDVETGDKFTPHVIEPSFGVDRSLLVCLLEAYKEDGQRVYLSFPPKIAPYKVAVFPLLANKPELLKGARAIYETLKSQMVVAWDDRGNIGKRYLSQDEIGTPFCITFDFQSLEDRMVTVRDRNTTKQERVAIDRLPEYLQNELK